MTGDLDQVSFSFVQDVGERAEQVDHWVKTALAQDEPVTWTNDLIAAAKGWLEGSGKSPDFIAAARVEIEDLHWAILSGIARGGSIVTHADR
jgi:hypothetical protein